jgi:hypothetical protein
METEHPGIKYLKVNIDDFLFTPCFYCCPALFQFVQTNNIQDSYGNISVAQLSHSATLSPPLQHSAHSPWLKDSLCGFLCVDMWCILLGNKRRKKYLFSVILKSSSPSLYVPMRTVVFSGGNALNRKWQGQVRPLVRASYVLPRSRDVSLMSRDVSGGLVRSRDVTWGLTEVSLKSKWRKTPGHCLMELEKNICVVLWHF